MTPNIIKAVKHVYTEGDPMDYTWVDLGNFDIMDATTYDKVMNNFNDLFHSDPSDLMLPFESMGIVYKENDVVVATTIDRTKDAVIGTIRSEIGDIVSIMSNGKEEFIKLNEILGSPEEYIAKMFGKDYKLKTNHPNREIFLHWSLAMNYQYAEYMRKAMDMHERTRVYKALPSISNSKRIRRNKQPLFEWKVIDVTAKPATHDIVATGNGRNSPRQHKRRGHFRQYKDGRRSWIPEALVGKIEFGYIYHSYTTEKQ